LASVTGDAVPGSLRLSTGRIDLIIRCTSGLT
jgi:hypothetical protein